MYCIYIYIHVEIELAEWKLECHFMSENTCNCEGVKAVFFSCKTLQTTVPLASKWYFTMLKPPTLWQSNMAMKIPLDTFFFH